MRKLMYTISRICLAGILLITSPSAIGQGEPKEKGFFEQLKTELQNVLNTYVTDQTYVGGVAAAIKMDDVAFWQGAAGYAYRNFDPQTLLPIEGGIPFTVNTPSQIYSVTKSFTAALVLELVRERVLSLDAHISDYLPLSTINPALDDFTIHQLLAHETNYSDFWFEPALQYEIGQAPWEEWDPIDALKYVQPVPDQEFDRNYSSSNYIMLGVIVEEVTGMTIEEHFRQRFFEPLDLNTMYLRGQDDITIGDGLAAPHDNLHMLNPMLPDAVINIYHLLPFDAIASLAFTSGGIVSTVADVAEWGSALFGGKATSKATLETILASIDDEPDDDGDYLGYGIWRTTKISETETFIGHDGNSIGYRSVMYYQPEKKITIAILTNDRGADLYVLAKALYEALPDFTCKNGNRKDNKLQVCYNGKLQCVDFAGAGSLTEKGAVLGACAADVKAKPQSDKLTHLRAHPNPVDQRTVFSFVPAQSGRVSLKLYDMSGNLKATLFEGDVVQGEMKQVPMLRGDLRPGVYFARLQTAAGVSQYKVVLNR